MSLTSYRAAPPRANIKSGQLSFELKRLAPVRSFIDCPTWPGAVYVTTSWRVEKAAKAEYRFIFRLFIDG